MDKDLVAGNIGPEASYDIALKGSKVELTVKYAGQLGGVGLVLDLDAKGFLEKLKALIPGTIDDAIINIVESGIA